MFEQLQQKWKVGGRQLLLILCTFAIGGSLTGLAGKRIMQLITLERGPAWVLIYVIVVTLIWPIAVLLISIPFGQFAFFRSYLRQMGVRLRLIKAENQPDIVPDRDPRPSTITHMDQGSSIPDQSRIISAATESSRRRPARLAIFASGAGSNAGKIIANFHGHPEVEIVLIVCNRAGAGVLQLAAENGIPTLLIERERFLRGDAYLPELKDSGVSFIVLAGFLWKIPASLIGAYTRRIVNIHPALLPAYGGKGMYGAHVHDAVVAAGEPHSGITIHYVDEHYDHGDIIFQERVNLEPGETGESLAEKIHRLEHEHFPKVIGRVLGVS